MDNLLKNKPMPLPNERVQMYELMDRFFSFIDQYQSDYQNLLNKKKNDLSYKETEKKNALKILKDEHNESLMKCEQKYTAAHTAENDSIKNFEEKTFNKIADEEKKLSDFISQKDVEFSDLMNKENIKINEYQNVQKRLTDIYNQLDNYLGIGFFGQKKLQTIVGTNLDNLKISTLDEALFCVSADRIKDAEKDFNSIKTIDISVLTKLIKANKKNNSILSIVKSKIMAEKAIDYLEKNSKHIQKTFQKNRDIEVASLRSKCNSKKVEYANRLNDFKKEKAKIIESLTQNYTAEHQQLSDKQKVKYINQEKHFDNQILNNKNDWNQKLINCHKKFIADIEKNFPPEYMNRWIAQFWKHPFKVENFSQSDDIQMNILIGVAKVNINRFLTGDTGKVIKQVLIKYHVLFGLNKQQVNASYNSGYIILPYSISIEEGTSLLFEYNEQASERSKNIVNGIAMRMLRAVPPCMMRFPLFDSRGIGGFASLMSLDPAAFNNPNEVNVNSISINDSGHIFSDSSEMQTQIDDLKNKMDSISSQLKKYNTLSKFNAQNPLSKEIYRPLIMLSFPIGLDSNHINKLLAMNNDCSKWGFSMLLSQPENVTDVMKPESIKALNDLKKRILCIKMTDSGPMYVENPCTKTEKDSEISIFSLPDDTTIKNITKEIRELSVKASKNDIYFIDAQDIIPADNERYRSDATNGISVPVGYLEGGNAFNLLLDDKSHVNAVIMGNTGSGKTNLLHVIMTNIMLRYKPEEVELCLVDFKYGKDFRIYTQYNLPNFNTISISKEPEFVLALLEKIEKIYEHRSDIIGNHQKFSEYNLANPNNKLNRIVIVIDELYELVNKADDDIQKEIINKIDSFVRQDRAFGVHLIIAGQDLDKIESFDTIKSQCSTRIAMQCSEAQVETLISSEAASRMRSIGNNDQGWCVFSVNAGVSSALEHTTYLPPQHHEQLLNEINDHYNQIKQFSKVKILHTKVNEDPGNPIQRFIDTNSPGNIVSNQLFIGEPISADRQLQVFPKGNLWITGGNASEDSNFAGNSIMLLSAVSLLMSRKKTDSHKIICTNFCDEDLRSSDDAENDRLGQFASNLPKYFNYHTGDDFENVLNAVLDELELRKTSAQSNYDDIWWMIVQPERRLNVNNNSNTIMDLKNLLSESHKYKIHILLWNADISKAETLQIEKGYFHSRICLEMSEAEFKIVNSGTVKNPPAGYKALYISSSAIVFRVFNLPDGKWMESLMKKFDF